MPQGGGYQIYIKSHQRNFFPVKFFGDQDIFWIDIFYQIFFDKNLTCRSKNKIYQAKPTIPTNLPNQTKPIKPNLKKQTYQTLPTNQTCTKSNYQTKPTKQNLPNQTSQIKPTQLYQTVQKQQNKSS